MLFRQRLGDMKLIQSLSLTHGERMALDIKLLYSNVISYVVRQGPGRSLTLTDLDLAFSSPPPPSVMGD